MASTAEPQNTDLLKRSKMWNLSNDSGLSTSESEMKKKHQDDRPPQELRLKQFKEPEDVEESRSPTSAAVPKRKLEWVLQNTRVNVMISLYNNPRYADASLVPQQVSEGADAPPRRQATRFYAQRAILANWSPVFDSIFYGEHPEEFGEHYHQEGEVRIDATADIIELFLMYIYKGEITLTTDTVWPLYCFVNTYQVQSLVDAIEEVMEKAVTLDTCCSLLACAGTLGSYDHYALRKCLNMLLMDFAEVSETPGFLTLDYEVLHAIVSSDELNASEECVFEGVMRWINSDDRRIGLYLDDLLADIRFPLMDSKYVVALDSHPIAAKSKKLCIYMLDALKFAVSPKEVLASGKRSFNQRKGGLYWKTTKNNMCLDIGSTHMKTFVLNCPCQLVESWKLKIELFDEGSYVVGVCSDECDPDYYIGRYKNGWGLAGNGHFYAGGCKCDPAVKHLCTPICQGHMSLGSAGSTIISICYNSETSDLIFRSGTKLFTQRLQGVNDRRLFPAVSLKNAKIRIFKENAEILE